MTLHLRAVSCLAMAVCTAALIFTPSTARAQQSTFPDVPANHWAYQAVQELADKGYVKGYSDGKFLGGRTMTRFEFATIIGRMVQTVSDLSAKFQAGQIPTTPTGTPVTEDDLNTIQALVDSFKEQLAAIQSSVAGATSPFQDQIDSLRQDVLDAKAMAQKAQETANNSYGAGPGRKYTISGYLQERFIDAAGGSKVNFPPGSPTSNSPYNGTYAAGGNNLSFVTRRARLRVAGAVTPNTNYALQVDVSGLTNNTPSGTSNSSNAAVTDKEAWVSYTFGNGDQAKNPTLTAGQFANPYGIALFQSQSAAYAAERPLAFNEGSAGIFANQDYDRGAELTYSPASAINLTAAAVNGTGSVSNDESRGVDQIYKIGAHTPVIKEGAASFSVLSGDVTYYDGHLPSSPVGVTYVGREKRLTDVDAQVQLPSGPFLLGEYESGRYEQRFFAGETATSATNPFGFGTADAPGNNIDGYYVQGGYTLGMSGAHAVTLFLSYDFLDRSSSGISAAEAKALSLAGGASGSSFDDENIGYGVLYNLDKAMRLRVYYTQPDKVAHANVATNPEPPRVGLTTVELQVKF